MTSGEVLRRATEHLAKTSDTSRLDAELLLAHTLGSSRIELYTDLDRPLDTAELDAYRGLVARRAKHEPVAYLLGEWGFRRLTLAVDGRALIPRPETEVVVGRCLELLRGIETPRVLDVGTGTGAIALAIADEHPGAQVRAIDASRDALDLARENVRRTGLPVELAPARLPRRPPGRAVRPGRLESAVRRAGRARDVDAGRSRLRAAHRARRRRRLRRDRLRGGRGAARREARSFSRWARASPTAWRACSPTLGYEDVLVTDDLAGRDRVVEGRR